MDFFLSYLQFFRLLFVHSCNALEPFCLCVSSSDKKSSFKSLVSIFLYKSRTNAIKDLQGLNDGKIRCSRFGDYLLLVAVNNVFLRIFEIP